MAEPCAFLVLRFRIRRVWWCFGTMRRSRHFSNAPGNKVGACVCLMAVILLWAPLWASAFQASSMACCDGAMCPVHGHAPKKSPHEAQPGKEAPPVACDHHSRNSSMSCNMACCHPTDPAVTGAILFVLPTPSGISAPALVGQRPPNLAVTMSSAIFDPASPPPRTLPLYL